MGSKDSSRTKTVQFKDQNTKEKESFLGLSSDSEETQGTLNKSDLKTSSLKIDQRLNQALFREKETQYSLSFETLHSSSDSEETQGTLFKSERETSSLKISQRLNQAPFKEKETPYSSSFETLHSSSVEKPSSLKSNLHSAGKEAQIIPQYLGDKVEYKTQNTKEKERYKTSSASSSRPSSDSEETQGTLFKSER